MVGASRERTEGCLGKRERGGVRKKRLEGSLEVAGLHLFRASGLKEGGTRGRR